MGQALPDSIVVNSPIGGRQEFRVVYDWKPQACSHCNTFGHDDAMCYKKQKSATINPMLNQVSTTPNQVWSEVQRSKQKQGAPAPKPSTTVTQIPDDNTNRFASLQPLENEEAYQAAKAANYLTVENVEDHSEATTMALEEHTAQESETDQSLEVEVPSSSSPVIGSPTLETAHEHSNPIQDYGTYVNQVPVGLDHVRDNTISFIAIGLFNKLV
ncbi:hypothetical protein QJS04_geneDACA011583 [Acorus gramineus]|uniref:Zinc knuckle CX2CX4HX4C domain-containing protein n=1 Tax=Acorus gramineus TaxID=55184 RepID=A0AAV9ABN0_ACOGR|nr:hypothetical protein QJS04_geneDACA011583 [Acorus gramineus]